MTTISALRRLTVIRGPKPASEHVFANQRRQKISPVKPTKGPVTPAPPTEHQPPRQVNGNRNENSFGMDRDINGARGIFLRALGDSPFLRGLLTQVASQTTASASKERHSSAVCLAVRPVRSRSVLMTVRASGLLLVNSHSHRACTVAFLIRIRVVSNGNRWHHLCRRRWS